MRVRIGLVAGIVAGVLLSSCSKKDGVVGPSGPRLAQEPTAQPTSLVFSTVKARSIAMFFTPSVPASAGYIGVRSISSSSANVPVDGTVYARGGAVGTDSVAYVGTANSFADSVLEPLSTYYYRIFAYNGTGTQTNYLTTSPLSGDQTTIAVPSSNPDFPSSGKFAVTLYTPDSVFIVNQNFVVRVVLYNVTNVFGAAIEVGYPSAKMSVQSISPGTTFFPPANVLTVSQVEADSQRVSYGVTYTAGSSSGSVGSGLMVTFNFKALASGPATFTINAAKLELKKADGTSIVNFNTILKENLTVNVQ